MVLELIKSVNLTDNKGNQIFGTRDEILKFETTVYENNAAALALANKQQVTSRTKHWSVKFHFFWFHINESTNNMKVVKVESSKQKADYLTKGLIKDVFENCRKLNQGW